MPVFSLRSQRLSGEVLNHRPTENHKLPNEPSELLKTMDRTEPRPAGSPHGPAGRQRR
jgi:hypothetical protein